MSRDRRKKLLGAGLAVFFLGLFLELFCQLPLLLHREEGNFSIPAEEAVFQGFSEKDGALLLTGEEGRIFLPMDGAYVGKLAVSYEYEGLLNMTAAVRSYNAYGEVRERDVRFLEDRNPKVLKTTWLPVNGRAEGVELTISRQGLFEAGLSYIDFSAMPFSFTGFQAVTQAGLNPYRLCFFWLVLGSALFLTAGRKLIGARVEAGFFVLALSAGLLFSLSLPAGKVGWDEEVHFEQSFWLANYRHPMDISPEIFQEFSAGIDTWPLNQPGGLEEQRELNSYLDARGDYRNGSMHWSADLNKTTMTGYASQAVFLRLGELLHLPFSLLFRLGRLGNLVIYCLVMALAVKKTPVGKGIMAFMGLMPAPMLLAGVYSYDPTVTAFLFLAFALILREALEPGRQVTWKACLAILFLFFWGCRIKAVYAPLILAGFLIPAERFRSKKEKQWMRAGFALAFLLLMASFVLPVLIAPRETGDLRGGATSEVGQMAYVLGQPLAYARVLAENILSTLPSYVMGEGAFGLLGHLGSFSFPWLFYAGGTAVILTDSRSATGLRLSGRQKLWLLLLSGLTVILVWTSMYIAFTPPGNTYIEGVQGRYYMPVLFFIWLSLTPGAVKTRLADECYYPLVLGLAAVILCSAYGADVLAACCL